MNIVTELEKCSEDMSFTGYIIFPLKDVPKWTQFFPY